MSALPLNVLAVVGSLKRSNSVTRAVVNHVAAQLRERGCAVDVLDLLEHPLPLYNPELAYGTDVFPALKARVDRADAYVLGTPDYHGSISSAMKNFLDHFWHEFAGKLFATIVASHEKGLTVTDQLRTVARQCYAWSLPYGLACIDREEVQDGRIVSASLQQRLEMFIRDVAVYGRVLALQRKADLTGSEPGFLARHRAKRSPDQ
ncbi:MAG: NADPH-dependent FMN reductase [Verrucomicrobiia bacterium]